MLSKYILLYVATVVNGSCSSEWEKAPTPPPRTSSLGEKAPTPPPRTSSLPKDSFYDNSSADAEIVCSTQPTLVKFGKSTCGNCTAFKPTWNAIVSHVKSSGMNVKIVAVDCVHRTDFCKQHNASGYPFIKWFRPSGSSGVVPEEKENQAGLKELLTALTAGATSDSETAGLSAPGQTGTQIPNVTQSPNSKIRLQGLTFVMFGWYGGRNWKPMEPHWNAIKPTVRQENLDVKVVQICCHKHKRFCAEQKLCKLPACHVSQLVLRVYNNGVFQKDFPAPAVAGVDAAAIQGALMTLVRGIVNGEGTVDGGAAVSADAKDSFYDNDSADAEIVSSTQPTLVKFGKSTCGNCKAFKPTWQRIGNYFTSGQSVKVVAVDCVHRADFCKQHNASGYLFIKWFHSGSSGVVPSNLITALAGGAGGVPTQALEEFGDLGSGSFHLTPMGLALASLVN